MPVPGKPTVVCVLFLPIVYLKPRVPKDIDMPVFEKFNVIPGNILILFQNLKPILSLSINISSKKSIVKFVKNLTA